MGTKKTATYPETLVLRDARDQYLAAHGFGIEDYTAPTFTIEFWGIRVRFPNPKSRHRVIPLHDLHHVLTGYATDWIGEGEIGAWELRAGCDAFIAYLLNGGGVLIGLCISPGRVWRAFRAAKGQRTLYRDRASYESLLEMSVRDVRERIGMPREGLVR